VLPSHRSRGFLSGGSWTSLKKIAAEVRKRWKSSGGDGEPSLVLACTPESSRECCVPSRCVERKQCTAFQFFTWLRRSFSMTSPAVRFAASLLLSPHFLLLAPHEHSQPPLHNPRKRTSLPPASSSSSSLISCLPIFSPELPPSFPSACLPTLSSFFTHYPRPPTPAALLPRRQRTAQTPPSFDLLLNDSTSSPLSPTPETCT
jgi:hypothetical protein